MKIVTADQMRRWEQACVPLGVSLDDLMERAGLEVALLARSLLGRAAGQRVVVLVGPGNNGADGLVAARHLQRWGAEVSAHVLTRRPEADPKLELALQEGMGLHDATLEDGLPRLRADLARCALVIDAVLGTGRARPMEGVVAGAMMELQDARRSRGSMHVLALDLPSGLDADTGQVDPACPRADVTATLGFPKVGLFGFPGAETVGRLEVLDIGIPQPVVDGMADELDSGVDDGGNGGGVLASASTGLAQGDIRACSGLGGVAALCGGSISGIAGGGAGGNLGW